MDNTLYVGLSRQMTLQHALDVIANNVANVDTAGFKLESLVVEAKPQTMPAGGAGPQVVNFAYDVGLVRDFSQGSLKQTGAPFDLAVDSQGFFKVSTPNGERYTRDGRFTLDPQGRMITQSGQAVQGEGGDIVVDPTKSTPKIALDGTVSQDGQIVGKVAVVTFSSLSALSKDGDGLFSNTSNLQPQPSASANVRQGMIESSNVEPINQITQMIAVSRAYESVSQMMSTAADQAQSTIDRLGRVS